MIEFIRHLIFEIMFDAAESIEEVQGVIDEDHARENEALNYLGRACALGVFIANFFIYRLVWWMTSGNENGSIWTIVFLMALWTVMALLGLCVYFACREDII